MIMDSETRYLKWDIPVPSSGHSYRDIVLGVKVKDLQLANIEAVIVSVEQMVNEKVLFTCEVITPVELDQWCSTLRAAGSGKQDTLVSKDDSGIMKWKLKERLLESVGEFNVAFEVKTWDGAPDDYGTIEIHWVETLRGAGAYYGHDPLYSEHQPFLHSLTVDNTGLAEIDDQGQGIKMVESYVFSKQGAHLLLSVRTQQGLTVQLWQIRHLPASDPRCAHYFDEATLEEQDETAFRPRVMAWLYLADVPESKSIDLLLSHEGTQLGIVDEIVRDQSWEDDEQDGGEVGAVGAEEGEAEEGEAEEGEVEAGEVEAGEAEGGDAEGGEGEGERVERQATRKDKKSWTAFYRFTPDRIGTGERPAGATAGSGLARINVAETCPGLANFFGRAEFHIVATKDQDIRDEILVACDGVTIEMYSVFGEWNHLRTIVIDPTRTSLKFRRNVFAALYKQLRGKYILLVNAEGTEVTTWNIETGEAVSSSTRFDVSEFWSLRHLANVTQDGRLVAVPGQTLLEIYETATWDLVGWYHLPTVGNREFVSEGLFIWNDTHIMVTVDSEEQPYYRNNRGYIIDLANMTVVEQYASAGHGRFELLPKRDPEEEQLFLAVDTSSACVFPLSARLLMAPRRDSEDEQDL
ncbi:hypothetical protein BGW39_010178 [Mortierella sp. 14UC]|nr:hypothetical protein BGW39_010178 [Mortierella sp. 14UC]